MTVLQIERIDRIPVARLPSDVDAANAVALADELAENMEKDSRELAIDLSGTRYLDSTGIEMLFRLQRRLAQRGARMRLVIAPDSPIARLAEIVSLPAVIPTHADVLDAVRAFSTVSASEDW